MSFLEEIKTPKPEYSPAAFWFWYGELEPEKLRCQIDMMVEQGVYNGFMHARAYLKTPYLEDDWWKAVSACIDEGEKVGFYPWLYDEYAWPSGTAGSTFNHGFQKPSRTLAKGECNMSKYLVLSKFPCPQDAAADITSVQQYRRFIAMFCKRDGKWQYVADTSDAEGEVLVVYRQASPRFVDYLNEDTIDDFIESTHEQYKARYSKYFGNRVPGLFFDEIFMIGRMPWTDRFADEFKKRCGYDIVPHLYVLAEPGNAEERKIRNDYYNVTSQLYEETFFKKISEWCRDNNLALTGHIEEFLIRQAGSQGQFFNNMRHLDIPGADCHDYRYRFPRKITYREPKFSVSVARAYGKKRMMSEALGGAGWGCSLQQFKRGINTLGAMGINMITLHGFYSECDTMGMQADWPNSFFYQNPYWRYFKRFADYINRICYMNTQGAPVVEVGIFYPIEDMQMETVAGATTAGGVAIDKAWNDALGALLERQIDVDMIDEPCLLNAQISDGCIRTGVQAFKVLLFPELTQHSTELAKKLDEFKKSGGVVLYYACGESCAPGVVKTDDLPDAVSAHIPPDVIVISGGCENLFVNHRRIDGREVYFVSNSSSVSRSVQLLLREKGSVQKICPEDGSISDIKHLISDNSTQVELALAEDEACWLVVDAQENAKAVQEYRVAEELAVAGTWEFLPISSKLDGAEQLKVKSTVLQIPLATFSSRLHPDGRQIRIQNTAKEKGNCRRHLSLWKAAWIVRRPDWIDNAMKKLLCFRRRFELADKPTGARICIAAVNEWTLYVNGKQVAQCSEGRVPSVVDICEYMKPGENLIAVKVVNETPMEHFNLLSVDDLPPEELISLLAQAEFTIGDKVTTLCTDSEWEVHDREIDGWQQPEYKPEVRDVDCTTVPMICGENEHWLKSWERGQPPLLPWGDLPLFGETISYPQRVCYCLTLPAGTGKIMYPEVAGSDVRVTVDGMELTWENGACHIRPDDVPRQLQIAVTANSCDDGLLSGVSVEVVPFRGALCDWRLHGLKWYSGFARYSNTMILDKKPGRYVLKLGQTAFQAEVWVNGVLAGDRVWEPYELDVTDLLRDGENEFVVIVSNSAAVERQFMLVDEGMALGWNRYWNYDNIQREGENLISGLQGPIQLHRIVEI